MEQHDKRAHERLDGLEAILKNHLTEHEKFEKALAENTEMTRQLVKNTQEIVDLVKGVKGFRALLLWLTPIVAAVYAAWTWVKS